MKREELAFLELLKNGLWNSPLDTAFFSPRVDWSKILRMSEEQSVVGIITDGVSQLPKKYHGDRPVMMQFFARTMTVEDENKRMNRFIPKLMEQLERQGVHSLLLKGQGVSLCYRQPLHRMLGDIDLLITNEEEYRKARSLMHLIAEEYGEEDEGRKHSAFLYKGMLVEIHGNFRFYINRQCRNNVQKWKISRLSSPSRFIENEHLKGVALPPVQFDVLFIFAHLIHHYIGGAAIGLRQVSDWMMFLIQNKDAIDNATLENDLDCLGLRKYWRVFGAMAVNWFGFPKEMMPLYDGNETSKGTIVLENIFKIGDSYSDLCKTQTTVLAPTFFKKLSSFLGQIPMFARNLKVFPADTIWYFKQFIISSMRGYKTQELTEE